MNHPARVDASRVDAMAAATAGCAAMLNTLRATERRGIAMAALRIAVETLEAQLDSAELVDCLEVLRVHTERVREHRKGLDQS